MVRFDLKALRGYGVLIIIIGVWSDTNLLLYLNPDLAGRVTEISIDWNKSDLIRILTEGGATAHPPVEPPLPARLPEPVNVPPARDSADPLTAQQLPRPQASIGAAVPAGLNRKS
jgi:hypothetical protein